jgi:MoxR-like ATPase
MVEATTEGSAVASASTVSADPSAPPMTSAEFTAAVTRIHDRVSEAIHGKPQAIGTALLTMLSRGHLLVEDVPGVGKTMLAKSLAAAVGGRMNRIQFTPDLLPSDVTGSSVFDMAARAFEFRRGPVFANIVLADEINRSSPKTQSALLECMAEAQVSVDGITYPLEDPFLVIATQNPIDMAGTYPLPEPQRDRFLARISIGYPDAAAEVAMLGAHAGPAGAAAAGQRPVVDLDEFRRLIDHAARIHASPAVQAYAVAIVQATRAHPEVRLGASPRATIHLLRAARSRAALDGRAYVLPDDLQALAGTVLAHRLVLQPHAGGGRERESDIVRAVLAAVPVPRPERG